MKDFSAVELAHKLELVTNEIAEREAHIAMLEDYREQIKLEMSGRLKEKISLEEAQKLLGHEIRIG